MGPILLVVGDRKSTNKYVLPQEGIRATEKSRVKVEVGQEIEFKESVSEEGLSLEKIKEQSVSECWGGDNQDKGEIHGKALRDQYVWCD